MDIDQVKRIEKGKNVTVAFKVKNMHGDNSCFTFYRSGCKGLLFTYEGKKYASDFQLFVTTVKERLRHLRPQERKGAELALLYKQRLNFPRSRVLKQMLTAGTFGDSAITTRDVDNCDYVYGKGYAEAAGKMVFKPTTNDQPNELIEEAMLFIEGLKDKEITLHSDIMFIDGLPFLIAYQNISITPR